MPSPTEIVAQYDHLKLHGANEAETRLKVINDVLYGVLGWTHADVNVEYRVSEDGTTTWADYVLRTGMTAIVLEAKKVGVTFAELPNARRVQLKGKFVTGETGAAIIQARDYARKLGVPFAVVTNGNAWVVFPATRVDQVSFEESSAIIFSSLKSALQDDYPEFYELLARQAVINGSLENELLGRIENQIEDRRLNRFFTRSFSRISRHSLFPLIEDAVATAFTEDVVNADPDLLEKCYVKTPERVRFDHRIKIHIATRASVTNQAPIRPLREGDSQVLAIVSGAAVRARPVAVLVLGQVGAGKTTFLEYTRKVGVYMGMSNRLAGAFTVVDANVEPAHRSVLLLNLSPKVDQEVIDCTSLRLKKIEEGRNVSLGHDQRVQFSDWIFVADCKRESIKAQDALVWNFTEDAT